MTIETAATFDVISHLIHLARRSGNRSVLHVFVIKPIKNQLLMSQTADQRVPIIGQRLNSDLVNSILLNEFELDNGLLYRRVNGKL